MTPDSPRRPPRGAIRGAALAAALAATIGCTHAPAAGYDQPSQATETNTMAEPSSATIQGEGLRLEAAFQAAAGQPLHVRYRVHNTGQADLAVFDRGNRHAVLTKRQKTGEVGQPTFREEGEGDLTISHVALPLPNPSPTLPPTPLAARLAAGQELEGEFTFSPLLGDPPKRIRWCLGATQFDEELFRDAEQAGGVEVWQASFTLVDAQQVLCTPWFDVAKGAFQAD